MTEMAREMALPRLSTRGSETEAVVQFLVGRSDVEREMSPDIYVRTRLSLLEIVLAESDALIQQTEASSSSAPKTPGLVPLLPAGDEEPFVWSSNVPRLRSAIREINERFRLNGIGFRYHNGVIQEARDDLVSEVIETPFWNMISARKWAVVEHDMKEALDRRDRGKSDSTFHALKALESVIKIISDEKNLTTGSERGASNYVENLASKRGRGLLADWEAEQLKRLFSVIRNPQGHGPGSAKPLVLNDQQTDFVIESAMSWIKSLVGRL